MTTSTRPARTGLDLQWVDPATRPQDDLFGHVNGRWLGTHEIPEDRSQDGAFRALRDRAEADVRAIIEECRRGGPGPDAAEDRRSVPLVHGRRAHRGGRHRAAAPAAGGDHRGRRSQRPGRAPGPRPAHRRTRPVRRVRGHRRQGLHAVTWCTCPSRGWGCPTSPTTGRTATRRSAASTSPTWPGWPSWSGWARAGRPARLAETVLELETALAARSWDRVTNRDAEKTYTLMTGAGAAPARAGLRLARLVGRARCPGRRVRRGHRAAAQLRRRGRRAVGRTAARAVAVLAGHPHRVRVRRVPRPRRGRRGLRLLRAHPVRHPAAAGALEARGLAGRGRAGRGGRPAVRRAALPGVGQGTHGHPGRQPGRGLPAERSASWTGWARRPASGPCRSWPGSPRRSATRTVGRTTRPCRSRPTTCSATCARAGAWATDYEFAKIGQEVDRGEWLMTPQTVNAYYHPRMNEIVFPAAILQPPFFDPDADDAANYGGIGAVIGHEIGHGFDDQGSRYDGDGNMVDWWTPRGPGRVRPPRPAADRAVQRAVPARAARAQGQRRAHGRREHRRPGRPDHRDQGLPDRAAATPTPPELDGLTGLQRVLFGWAQVWRAATRDAEADPPAGRRPALAAGPALQRGRHQPGRLPRGLRGAGVGRAVHRRRSGGCASGRPHSIA